MRALLHVHLRSAEPMRCGEHYYLWKFSWWPLFEVVQWRRYGKTARG